MADAIIPEPEDGAQGDLDKMSQNIKEYLVKTIAVKPKKILTFYKKNGILNLEKSASSQNHLTRYKKQLPEMKMNKLLEEKNYDNIRQD